MKKLIGILICTLLLSIAIFQASGNIRYKYVLDEKQITTEESLTYKENCLHGWPVTLDTEGILASPVPYDFNNDGRNEIVVATYGPPGWPYGPGKIYVIKSDGKIASGWPVETSGPAPATPAVGDLDNDGIPEIVATDWNNIYVLHFDGSIIWQKSHGYEHSGPSPVLADVDRDTNLEIILTAKGGKIFVWSHNGDDVAGWPITINSTHTLNPSTPAVWDLDGDGYIEIVVNTEDDYTYVFNHDGTILDGWPVLLQNDPEWWANICRPPAIADLDGDGDFEIVRDGGTQLYVFERDGSIASGWPQSIKYLANNAFCLGDLDCDDLPEIVFGRSGEGYWNNYFYAFNGDGSSVPGWPLNLSQFRSIYSPCVMGDMDSSLPPEIIVRSVFDKIYVYKADGSVMDRWPKFIDDASHSGTVHPSPLITDLDGNGHVEIVACSMYNTVYAWYLSGSYDINTIEWPMFQHDPLHTGFYDNKPPIKPSLNGPINGKARREYDYIFSAVDPDGDDIASYTIDWGDNNVDVVEGPFASGEEIIVSHTWFRQGTYDIRAKAKDIFNAESDCSDQLSVTMPRNKATKNVFTYSFFEQFPNSFPILRYILRL